MPRPRSFDPEELLERAMTLFWAHGYAGASVDRLVAESGVNRASLYSVFPDKRALFVAAVDRYLDRVTAPNLRALAAETDPVAAVRQLLGRIAESDGKVGCLLTNSAIEFGVDDEVVNERVRGAWSRLQRALAKRLSQARDSGRLAAGVDPGAYATSLVALVQGLRVMSRAGAPKSALRSAVNEALRPLG